MKEFVRVNWFRLSILFLGLLVVFALWSYSYQKNDLERQELLRKQNEEIIQLEKQKFIDDCISDAYLELKTLQGNFQAVGMSTCAKNLATCDTKFWNDAEDEAFDTYQEEWIPQCKLGKRVFIDYEPYDLSELMNN